MLETWEELDVRLWSPWSPGRGRHSKRLRLSVALGGQLAKVSLQADF